MTKGPHEKDTFAPLTRAVQGGEPRSYPYDSITHPIVQTATYSFANTAELIVTDRLRSYGTALRQLGAGARQHSARHANNRAENSHLPFRRRERAMLRFRRMKTLQLFAAVHSSVSNYFNQDRSLSRRQHFKTNRTAALAEWRQLGIA